MTTVAAHRRDRRALRPVVQQPQFSRSLRDSVQNGELVATGGEWLGATVGAGLYVALLGLLSLPWARCCGTRRCAITTMIGLILLPLLLALFMAGARACGVQEALIEYSPLNGLASLFRMPMDGDSGGPAGPCCAAL